MPSLDSTERLLTIERRVRHLTLIATLASVSVIVLGVSAWTSRSQSEILRARQLILEDGQGRARIMLGAPLPGMTDLGRELPPRIGMVINDSAGFERFGLSLRSNGSIGMGFDAPPGTGDDRNRERINIVATSTGGAYIRYLNRKTSVVGYLQLGNDDRLWLDFLEYSPDSVVQRRVGIVGDATTRRAR